MEANELLTEMQETEDARGYLLRFPAGTKKAEYTTVQAVVDRALTDAQQGNNVTMIVWPDDTKGKRHRENQAIGSRRSLEDLYLLCKYYVPGVTIFDVRDYLNELMNEGRLATNFCGDFNRQMFSWETVAKSYINSYRSEVMKYGFHQ